MEKDKFITTLVPIASKLGWNIDSMEETSVKLGLDPNYYQIIFDGGIDEIKDYYDNFLDQIMIEKLSKLETPSKIREKIALALKIRIRLNEGFDPSLKSAWRTCDNIWRYTGDISTDFNHYTKRGLLTPVYLSSLKFYRNDKSENQIGTDQYITSSLDKIIKVFSIKSKLPKLEDIPILRLFS